MNRRKRQNAFTVCVRARYPSLAYIIYVARVRVQIIVFYSESQNTRVKYTHVSVYILFSSLSILLSLIGCILLRLLCQSSCYSRSIYMRSAQCCRFRMECQLSVLSNGDGAPSHFGGAPLSSFCNFYLFMSCAPVCMLFAKYIL